MSKYAKTVLCLLFLTLLMGITGCNNSSTCNNVSEMNNNSNSDGEVKVSELFLTDELRLWYLIGSDESGTINYDGSLTDMFVCKNGNIERYRVKGDFTLETIDGMTNEEIISFVESNYGSTPVVENIEFVFTRDTSGNNIEREVLQFNSFADKDERGLYYKKDLWYPGYVIKKTLEPQTILSNQYFGILESGGGHYPDALITKYDFKADTKIVLNDVNDECMVEKD